MLTLNLGRNFIQQSFSLKSYVRPLSPITIKHLTATVQTVTFDEVKLVSLNKTKNSLTSIAIYFLPWSLLTQ